MSLWLFSSLMPKNRTNSGYNVTINHMMMIGINKDQNSRKRVYYKGFTSFYPNFINVIFFDFSKFW